MRYSSLCWKILALIDTNLLFLPIPRVDAGEWVYVSDDYHGLFQTLPGWRQWDFNATRGPDELWTINLTMSGVGFNHTTLLVCDENAYFDWQQNGNITSCLLVERINWSLHTQVILPHLSLWHVVLNNTRLNAQLFSLTVKLYRWGTSSQTSDPFAILDYGLTWFIGFAVVIFVIIPCVCSVACRRRRYEIVEEVVDG